MSQMVRVISEARKLATPSPEEEEKMRRLARSLLAKTKRSASKFAETRGVLVGGSYAKGTWLPGHVDLDIFVRLDRSTPDAEFERIGLRIGETTMRGYPTGKKFAQHPYTEATVEGVRVNIVPCFAVKKGEWKSAADRSPYHVTLVKKIPEVRKAQVKLLKLFMNAVGVYGAEIERRGFSGYVAEVLVMKMGTFEKVLRWFGGGAAPVEGRPFTLQDPVDEARDLGIAVSGESLGRMVLASREFLNRPDLAYFHSMAGKVRPSMRGSVVALLFSHRPMSEDTLWGELRRTSRHIVRHVEVQGFTIARSMSASNNKDASAILLIPEISELPPSEQRVGPTVDRRNDVEAFLTSNSKDSRLVWVDDDARLRLLKPRKHTLLTDLLKDLVSGKEGKVGASLEIERGLKRSGKVLNGVQLWRVASRTRWLHEGIREITSDAVGTR